MIKRLTAAAFVVVTTFLGTTLLGAETASALAPDTVRVCNRIEEIWPGGPLVCTEWTTCTIYESGRYICDDGSAG
jgi:hypothetical protein